MKPRKLQSNAASKGWLQNFKARRKISHFCVSGESADVPENLVKGWHDRLWGLNQGYDLCDVQNADETASFYRVLPNKSLSEKGKQCKGGELSKKRKAVVLFANSAEGKPSTVGAGC